MQRMNSPFLTASAVLFSLGIASGLRGQYYPPANQITRPVSINNLVVVEDEADAAKAKIKAEASELLKRRDYRALDDMAARLLRSGVTFARGDWPIYFFYNAFSDLPEATSDAAWQVHLQALRDWFENDPDSINPRVALARALYSYAFVARGEGWASSVTQEGWRLFHERVTEASRILRAAEELGQSCPVYYSTRLMLSSVDGTAREQYDDLFDKSVQAFPTYANFYRLKANYLLPRWHGEEGEWERFIATAADLTGGEDGDILYTRIVWAMHDARLFGNILKESKVEWPRVQRGFLALCRRYPKSISAPSEYCALSGFAPTGAPALVRSLFPPLENRIDLSVWKTKEAFVKHHQWAFADQ
jgi:hypothetical protein